MAEKALEAKAQNGMDHAAAAAKIAANRVAGNKVDEAGILANVRAAVAELCAAATSTALVQMVSALLPGKYGIPRCPCLHPRLEDLVRL